MQQRNSYQTMSNMNGPLFRELADAADSAELVDHIGIMLRREMVDDQKKESDLYKMSNEVQRNVKERKAYIDELCMKDPSAEAFQTVQLLKRMQDDDTKVAARLMELAKERGRKSDEKEGFMWGLRFK